MYTTAQVNTILSSALNSLYRIQTQAERERYLDGDSSLSGQPPLILCLYEAVKWAKDKGVTTDEYYGLVAYLYSKVEKALAGLVVSSGGNSTPPADDAAPSTLVYYWEFFVPATATSTIPGAGDTLWVNENFVNRTLEVEYGGLPLPGIATSDGSVYFLKPYSSNTLRFYNLTGGLAEGALLKVRAWSTGS